MVGRGEEPRAMPRLFRVEALPGSEFRSERPQGTCRAELSAPEKGEGCREGVGTGVRSSFWIS